MARINLKPIEPLDIVFSDGTVKTALFNNEAFIIYTHEFGEFPDVDASEDSPYDYVSNILYCGLKVLNPSISVDEAKMILIQGGEDMMAEIMRLIIDNFLAVSNEETKKKFQVILDQTFKQIS